MSKRPYTSYNVYFLVPFLIWAIVGGCLLFFFNKDVLFTTINTHYTPPADILMYYATWVGEGSVITTLLLLLFIFVPSFRNLWFFITALLCNVLPTVVTQTIKHMVDAPRPLNYFHDAGWVHTLAQYPKMYYQSFPSGHSTGSFSLFCFLSMMLPAKYQKFGLLFFLMALMVAYSRMYLAAHFFLDVYTGSMIGGCVSMAIFSIMKQYQENFFKKKEREINL